MRIKNNKKRRRVPLLEFQNFFSLFSVPPTNVHQNILKLRGRASRGSLSLLLWIYILARHRPNQKIRIAARISVYTYRLFRGAKPLSCHIDVVAEVSKIWGHVMRMRQFTRVGEKLGYFLTTQAEYNSSTPINCD